MSIRNLDALFHPQSIALIGASNSAASVGLVTAKNLLAAGFEGPVLPVNPKHRSVAGVLAYPDVESLPVVPDLAVICTPPKTVPHIVAQLGTRGTKGAIVITAGFGELGREGRALQQQMLDAAKPYLLRIVGPNCVGVLAPYSGVNASFAPAPAKRGGLAFVTQSGAMATTVLDWANARGIGFSHVVSLGDMADVDFGDMLDYLANDVRTTAILLYVEAITSARKLMSAARAASRVKPVIAIKAGRHLASAKAAASHTGALAGTDAVYEAAFRRAGIVRVIDLDEMFDAVETIAHTKPTLRQGLVIVTNGGGAGVLATDALLDRGGHLTELTRETIAKLDTVLPPTWSHANPVDIIGDAQPQRYADTLEVLFEAPETDAIMVVNCPTAIASSIEAAEVVAKSAPTTSKAVLANWLGTHDRAAARAIFAKASVPAFDTPTAAVRGFSHIVQYCKGQQTIIETPASRSELTADETEARRIVVDAVAAGREWLTPFEVQQLLACYRIPAPRVAFAATPAQAGQEMAKVGPRVALKIVSKDILHKSDVGGVVLNLTNAESVVTAATAMQARVAAKLPNAEVSGFLVQEMITRPGAHELILGVTVDAQFGPVILFGHGGTAVEAINDKALALPPLNRRLAHELIGQTRIVRLLHGYRDQLPAAIDDIAESLVRLSQLVCDLDEVVEIDINPLLADAKDVIAVDARIRVSVPQKPAGSRLVIVPYPHHLETTRELPAVGTLSFRPIKPEDANRLVELIGRTSPQDLRMRFFGPVQELSRPLLARLTQIDYDREMAFVVTQKDDPETFVAVGRLVSDPDIVRAEFALLVRTDMQRRGIGRLLLQHLISYARSRGLTELVGDVLSDNSAMRSLCKEFGFESVWSAGNSALRVRLNLR